MTKTILIEGMSCSHCSSRVESALSSFCNNVKVSLNEKKAYVEINDSISNDLIKETIEDLGFEVISIM